MRRMVLLVVLAAAPMARAEPSGVFTRSGLTLLGVGQTGLGGTHAGRGRGLLLGGEVSGDDPEVSLGFGMGVIAMRPFGDGDDGGFANLWGLDLRLRAGTSLDQPVSVGGQLSFQWLDGRWRATDGVHHAFTSNAGIGPYATVRLGAGLQLMIDGAVRGGFLLDHTRPLGDVVDGRWHGAAELELGAGLLGLWN